MNFFMAFKPNKIKIDIKVWKSEKLSHYIAIIRLMQQVFVLIHLYPSFSFFFVMHHVPCSYIKCNHIKFHCYMFRKSTKKGSLMVNVKKKTERKLFYWYRISVGKLNDFSLLHWDIKNLHLFMQCTVKISSKQERHFYFLHAFIPTTSRSHNKSSNNNKKRKPKNRKKVYLCKRQFWTTAKINFSLWSCWSQDYCILLSSVGKLLYVTTPSLLKFLCIFASCYYITL